MEHFWWALALGAVIFALTLWIFVILGKKEKKLAYMQIEEAALEKGDESLSLLLQQCQSEEEREIVFNFAKEQMEKEERIERERNSNQETKIITVEKIEPQDSEIEEGMPAMTTAAEPVMIPDGTAYENDVQSFRTETMSENEEEYTRIVDRNSLI